MTRDVVLILLIHQRQLRATSGPVKVPVRFGLAKGGNSLGTSVLFHKKESKRTVPLLYGCVRSLFTQ